MKHLTLIFIGLLAFCLTVPVAFAAESPDGAWVVRLEAPFVKEMALRIDLEIAGGKAVQAVAGAIHFNLALLPRATHLSKV